jgi:hypothetical protein
MKHLRLIYIFSLLLGLQNIVLAEEATEETSGYYQQQDDELDQLSKLMEIPDIKKVKKVCETENATDLGTCIWGKVKKDPALSEKVQALMDETLEEHEGISQHESVKVVSLKNDDSESIKALEKFYAEKLSKELFGESAPGSTQDLSKSKTEEIIDHKKFNKIFENQMTKNILSAVSTYCIEADLDHKSGFPVVKPDLKDRQKQRKENIKSLSGPDQDSTDDNGNTIKVSALKKSSSNWQNCMLDIQYVCHGGKKQKINPDDGKFVRRDDGTIVTERFSKSGFEDDKEVDVYDYSKTRACEVTNYLKIAKQNLKALEKISAGYEELASGSSYGLEGKDINKKVIAKEIVLDKGKLDNITSTTSNEFVNEAGFAGKTNDDLANLEKCIKLKDKVNDSEPDEYEFVGGAQETCKKYLNTDHESVEKIKLEHDLRQRALAAKVEKLKDGSEDEIKQFLIDQGRDEESIEEDLKNVDFEVLREQITNRFAAEKEELIKSLNQKLEKQTSSSAGAIDLNPNGGTGSDLEKLSKIHEELSAKTESYAQLIHYNNMVTGLLEIKDDKGKSRRNTASVTREMENNAFSEKNIEGLNVEDKQGYISNTENLEEVVAREDISESSSDSESETSTTIGVKKINEEVLNYDANN